MSSTNDQRSGTTLTEMVVAATLMVSTMAIVAPLTVRTGRLWQDARRHQLVMNELSNELERLTSLTRQQRERAIAEFAPTDHLRATLPSVTTTAETVRDGDGTRLRLSVDWDRPGNPQPITLVGWLDPLPAKAASDPNAPETGP